VNRARLAVHDGRVFRATVFECRSFLLQAQSRFRTMLLGIVERVAL
jgi:hypothetical protein